MRYEVRYMVDGCGKKIPSTRTIVVYDGDKMVAEVRTQEELNFFSQRYEKETDPPGMEAEKGEGGNVWGGL